MKKVGLVVLTILLMIGFFPQKAFAAQNPGFEEALSKYLTDISEIRGFDISKDDINASLAYYDESIDNFGTVDELRNYLGDVIKSDLSNLNELYKMNDLDKDKLLQLLSENGDDLNDYVYVDDLNNSISFYQQEEATIQPEFSKYSEFLNAVGITEEEMIRLGEHFEAITDIISSPEKQAQLNSLAGRLMAFNSTTSPSSLTAEQTDEIISVYNDCLSIFKIKLNLIVGKDGKETPVSFADLIKMNTNNIDLMKIEIYNTDSQFLADFVITEEIVKNNFGALIDEAAKEAINAEVLKPEAVSDVKQADKKNVINRTVKGAKLPKTASAYLPLALLGLIMSLAGNLLYRKVRKDEIRNSRG